MLPNYESFVDASPEKGVITVEYYWQSKSAAPHDAASFSRSPGDRTSMVFFKRILTTDKCWCGSRRAFGKCHRRHEDWTYVTLEPDRHAYSPVVLLQKTLPLVSLDLETIAAQQEDFLWLEEEGHGSAWALATLPCFMNEIGTLALGFVQLRDSRFILETNSEKRLAYMEQRIAAVIGAALPEGELRRMEPQIMTPPVRKRGRRVASGMGRGAA